MVCEAVEEYAKRKADEVAKEVAIKTTIEEGTAYGVDKVQVIARVTEKYGIDEEEAETLYNTYAKSIA